MLQVALLVVCVVVLVASLYWNARDWEEFMHRTGLRPTRGLDVIEDPIAAAARGAALEREREDRRRELLARAPSDRRAARELERLLSAEIRAFERTISEIRRDSKVRSAIPEDVFRGWDEKLAELKRLKDQVARYRIKA
jgi:hypothetical protein